MHKSVNFTFQEFLNERPCPPGLHLFCKIVFGDDPLIPTNFGLCEFVRYVQDYKPKLLCQKLTAKYVMKKVLEYEKEHNTEIDNSFIYWFCNIFKYPELSRFALTQIEEENRKNAKLYAKEEGYLLGWWCYTYYSQTGIVKKIREFVKGNVE